MKQKYKIKVNKVSCSPQTAWGLARKEDRLIYKYHEVGYHKHRRHGGKQGPRGGGPASAETAITLP